MTSRLYSVATVAWTLNIVASRLRARHCVSRGVAAALVYAVGVLVAARFLRRRWGLWGARLAYVLWLPLAYATVCYDHHSLLPRVPWLAFLAWVSVVDLALTGSQARLPLALATVLTTLTLVDWAWPHREPEVRVEASPPRFWVCDSLLGYRPLSNTVVSVTAKRGTELVYHVTYSLDTFGRRTPDDEEEAPRRHLVFCGNSMVFGDKVADDQTLPAHVARATRGFSVYNLGFSGWGPQQTLVLLRSGQLKRAVAEASGLLLFGCFHDHVRRALGSYTPAAWGANFPRFVIHDGALVQEGSFATSCPRRLAWFGFLRSSPSLDLVARRLEQKRGLSLRGWDLVVAILRECAAEYRRQFHGTFVVFFWPLHPAVPAEAKRTLEAEGIPVVDLAELGMKPPEVEELVPDDAHPSGAYYAKVAPVLVSALDRLGLLGPSDDASPRGSD